MHLSILKLGNLSEQNQLGLKYCSEHPHYLQTERLLPAPRISSRHADMISQYLKVFGPKEIEIEYKAITLTALLFNDLSISLKSMVLAEQTGTLTTFHSVSIQSLPVKTSS